MATVPGVGEPDPSFPINRQVVGGVQLFPVQPVSNYGSLSVGVEAHNRPPAGAAAIQPALSVKCQTIGVVSVAAPQAKLVGARVIPHNAAGAYVSKQHRL